MAKRSATDSILIIRPLQQKFFAKKEGLLWMAFVDLEKSFVPCEVVWWALRSLGMDSVGTKGQV